MMAEVSVLGLYSDDNDPIISGWFLRRQSHGKTAKFVSWRKIRGDVGRSIDTALKGARKARDLWENTG